MRWADGPRAYLGLAMFGSELVLGIATRSTKLPAQMLMAPLRAALSLAVVLLGLVLLMEHLPAIFSEALARTAGLLESLAP